MDAKVLCRLSLPLRRPVISSYAEMECKDGNLILKKKWAWFGRQLGEIAVREGWDDCCQHEQASKAQGLCCVLTATLPIKG